MSAIGLFRGLRRSVSRQVVKVNNTSSSSNRVHVRYMGGHGGGHGNNITTITITIIYTNAYRSS